MPLNTSVDTTYADDPGNPGVKQHQQDHDALHTFYNQWEGIAPADKADTADVLPLTGGTLTGALTLSGAPTVDLHAATKKYVDDNVGAVSSIFVPAAAMHSVFNSPSLSTISGGEGVGWLLDAASTEQVASTIVVPSGWGTADLDLWWSNAGAGSGNVRWQLFRLVVADGGSLTGSTGTSSTIAAPATGVAKKSTIVSGLSVTAGSLLYVVASRVGGDAADTLGNDAAVIGINVRRAS